MTSTQEVVSQAAAELQEEAPPRTWPFLGPTCDSTVAATTECFSPFFPLVVQQRRSGASSARAARTARARTPTRSTTGVDHATHTSADASSGFPGLSSAAKSGSSSVRRTAPTADNGATASATSEAGNCSLLLGNRQEQRKQRHRVIRLHPESFELPRLPASAAFHPRATSSTRQRGPAAQSVSSTLLADSHSARVDQDSGGPASYSQSSGDASAAGAFTVVAQREALLAAFAAAAVADAASLSSTKGPGEGQRHRPHAGKANKKLAGSRRTNSLSAAAAGANTAGDGSSLAREKSKRCAAYQQQLMELQAAAAADDAALLQALEAEREHVRQRKLQEEQDRRKREEEEERRRQERKAREEAAAAAAAREEQLRRERQAAEEQRRRFEEEEAKKKKAQEEEEKRRREQEERRRLEQQLEEQRRRQAEEEERQRHQREQEERQRREKEEQQQQLRQAQEQPPPQREQEKQEDVGALQQQQQGTDSGHGEAGTTVDTAAAISASNWLPAVEPGKPETAYMREVETLLAEERGMREVQLHQLPGISEDQVKALRISIKKQINTALNQLASTTSQVIRTCEGIRHFMRGLKGHPPAVSQFFVTQACERLLQLTEKGGQVSTRPSSVWAYAFLVRGMVQEDERVERAFRAHVYATCCYAAPFYYRKKQGMSVEQFRVARGQREGEDEEAFFSRMVACLRLWLSFLVASHKEEMAWSWLARFLNLNLATAKAVRRVCACALIEGLKIAGPALLKAYGRQFKKVMDLIQNALMPLLLAMQQKNEGTCISMYVTQLRTLLSDYYANNFTLPEPEGKSMKMEATEASPDV